jgi:hypothetical protein
MRYEKPIAIVTGDVAESIYMASGETTVSTGEGCNSKYMNGTYQAPDYSNTQSYYGRFGCNGCPAFRWNGCGIQMEYFWDSYHADDGNRMPNWEKIGHQPNDPIDWNDVGMC